METILEIKDVKKRFGAKEILKGINLSVMEGEIISVLGPSGCPVTDRSPAPASVCPAAPPCS